MLREAGIAIVEILTESSPYLLLGFMLAGAIHVLLQRFPGVTTQLTGSGTRPIFMAALLGAPMPLCSCSVLPAALALRRKGASKGTTASFLVSVPETDIVSILVTLALIGPFVAVYRPVAALASALVTGLVIRVIERREAQLVAPASSVPAGHECHCDAPETPRTASRATASHISPRPWWARAFHYGFIEMFDDIAPQSVLGMVIAAVIGVLLPDVNPRLFQEHTVLSYLLMVAIGIPVYVCAAASTPIAAGLIAGGVSPGAAMVFLLAGPATNVGSMVVLRNEFGSRVLAAYVGLIALTAVALGALLDALAGPVSLRRPGAMAHAGTTPFFAACAALFVAWTVVSFHRSRLVPRLGRNLARLSRVSTR
jgi:hypothetical protein